ncbi:hypothetical protein SAMN04487944_10755 [Gracilibacillus ureilyticus]|uniref:Uncharacterized protein n=1 Tax=Gracilibacillus ureilyticus TaxID=531814 RepID=A0A1H9QPV9_9BACI|nr:hypothetical protein SAMN04487944_10755 [Gracilibacillus ureilyticus]
MGAITGIFVWIMMCGSILFFTNLASLEKHPAKTENYLEFYKC